MKMKKLLNQQHAGPPAGKTVLITTLFLLCMVVFMSVSGYGQLKGTHLLGDAGLQAGTQAPPSITLAVPMYNYSTSKLVRGNGDKIDVGDINAFLVGVGGLFVTNKKILGANYGASILVAFMSKRLEGNLISTQSSLAFTDMYVQPVQLGWKRKRADFNAGYALYIPTGKYELGGSDNAGMGMLTNEFSAGTTVYLSPKKDWSFATLISYALNGAKKNTGNNEITVGNLLTVEGGLGHTWIKPVKNNPLPMIINAGMVYYMQFKTTSDKMMIPAIGSSVFDLGNKDRVYGLGIESNVFIPSIKGSIAVRWLGELGARNRTQGSTFFITLAPYIRFLHPAGAK